MEKAAMSKLNVIAGTLLVVNAVLHFVQLPLYGATSAVMGVVGFGVIYLVLGVLLIVKKATWTLWTSVALVSLGAVLGLREYLTAAHPMAMMPVFVLLDAAILPCCVVAAVQMRKAVTG
jgi:hypothetical protein